MPASITLARAVTLALTIAPALAWAAQFDYSLHAGVEHSDNINLTSNNPVSQNVFIPGADFTFVQRGSAVQANVAGTVEYHDYLGHRFHDQTLTQLGGQANWTVLPQRLDFSFEDYAGVQPVDSLASNAPDNQQQTNVLSFGPTLHMRFGDALRAQAELRYINSYASKVDDFNSSRGVGAFRIFRDLSPTDQLSANVESQRVNFENGGDDSNYTRNEAFVRYTSKLVKFDADLVVGMSQLHFDNAPSDSSPLARLTLGWRPTLRSTVSVSGAYQYADAAQDMMLTPGGTIGDTLGGAGAGGVIGGGGIGSGGGISTGNTVINSQVYLERLLQATYSYGGERLSLSIAPLYRKLHYLNDPTFDQVGRGFDASLGYRLRPTLTLSLYASGEKLTYQSMARRDKTTSVGLELARQLTSHWSWNASVTRQRRNSDAPGQSYSENQIFFGVVYRR
jgi:hypothetical protein